MRLPKEHAVVSRRGNDSTWPTNEKIEEIMTEYNVHRVRFVEYKPQAVNCLAVEDAAKQRLAVCRENGTIEVWSTQPSKHWSTDLVIASRIGRSIDSVAWCNSRLFTAGLEGQVIEWDLESLKEKNVVDANGGPVWCLVASGDKRHLAAGCEDGAVRLFDVQGDNLELAKALDKQEFRVLSLAWSHCGNIIVTGSTNSTICIYNVKSRHIVTRISTDKLHEKNTLIWSINLTKDMTIVSGDSLGQTQFWDAETGTLLQSFKSHEADVLTVCVSMDESSIYSSGIDCRIAEFKFMKGTNQIDGDWKLTRKLRSGNHDVRSLGLVGNPELRLVAGGIDPRITHFDIRSTENSYHSLSLFPDNPPCSFAREANLMIFQDNNKVHLWKLPFLSSSSTEPYKIPQKLLELKSCREDHIVCSDVSANGNILVYADCHGMSAFGISNAKDMSESTPISVAKIKIPQKHMKEIQRIKLTVDGSSMIFASPQGVGKIALKDEEKVVKFMDLSRGMVAPVRLLEVDLTGSYVACVDGSNSIHIYCLKEYKLVSMVPKLQCKPLAIKFQPETNNLVFVCSKKELHRYNFITEKLDPWCSKLNEKKLLRNLPTRSTKFVNIVFDQSDNTVMFLQAETGFVKVKIGGTNFGLESITKTGEKRKMSDVEGPCLSSTTKYSSILYLDITAENSLVVVERLLDEILNSLPPALKLKRFGT